MLASVMLKMGTYGLLRFCVPMFPVAARNCSGWIVDAGHHRHRLRRAGGPGAAQHEEAGRLFLGQPSWFRGARDFQLHATGIRWRGVSDAESWHPTGALFIMVGSSTNGAIRSKSTLTVEWHACAASGHRVHDHHARQHRAPDAEQFHRRISGPARTALINLQWTAFAAVGVILSACYMLWLYQRVCFGKAHAEVRAFQDLTLREYAIEHSAHHADGLDGYLHAKLHSVHFTIHRGNSGSCASSTCTFAMRCTARPRHNRPLRAKEIADAR